MDSKGLSQQRYNKFAEGYVNSQSHARGYDLNRLVELAQPQSDWWMLDIATGGGHTALKFAPHVDKVIATDITPQMLAAAKEFIRSKRGNNIDFNLADAEALPFDEGVFDLVTCRIAPHHFPNCEQFVREGARVLKPGGKLLVQDHVLPKDDAAALYVDKFERLRDPSHNRAFNQQEWEAMFEKASLTVEYTEEIIKRHLLCEWAKRQGCSIETVKQLKEMLQNAHPIAAAWLDGHYFNHSEASFVNHHILIMGINLPEPEISYSGEINF